MRKSATEEENFSNVVEKFNRKIEMWGMVEVKSSFN